MTAIHSRRPVRKLYQPTDLQPGAWITWRRCVGPYKYIEVTGQVWSAAPDSRTVWAIVEGERPVQIKEHYRHVPQPDGTRRRHVISLTEIRKAGPTHEPVLRGADETTAVAAPAIQVNRRFTNAAVIQIDGVEVLVRRRSVRGTEEIVLEPWGPARGDAEENPGWAVIDRLVATGHAQQVREGLSMQPDDRTVWVGPAIPGL